MHSTVLSTTEQKEIIGGGQWVVRLYGNGYEYSKAYFGQNQNAAQEYADKANNRGYYYAVVSYDDPVGGGYYY